MADDRWRPQKDDEDEEEDDDEEIDETGFKTVNDATLFAIEVNPSMLRRPPLADGKGADKDAPVSAALKCAYHLMQQRIISNPKDMIGILLFGTALSKFQGEDENGSGGLTYPHCYLLVDLDIPAATDVKALRSMIEDEEVSRSILVPSEKSVSMANVLFCANQIFTTKAPNFVSRRLFIVTDEDNPHAHDRVLRSTATVRAKDLYDLGVTLELFPIDRPENKFDRSKFYEDIIYSASPTDPDALATTSTASKAASSGDGITLLNSLLSSINSKAVTRRALFSNMTLELGPGCSISVKGFILFKRQQPARSSFIWLGGEKPQLVKGVTKQLADDDAARPVEKAEIKKAYRFGGEEVVFTPEEITSLRTFGGEGGPIVRVVGFKPLSMLPIWASTKQSTFIYPSEEDYVGSTRVFSALHQKLLEDEKMALTWFVARKNAAPVMAALVPGAEQLGSHEDQTIPPGMWIVPLPFADDIRQHPDTVLVRSPDSLVDIMRAAVETLQLPKGQYDPERYPNPALQWHYRILQAMALDEDLPDQPEDKTIPKYKQISKRAGKHLDRWNEEFQEQYRIWREENRSEPIAPKRKATGATSEIVTKRTKTGPAGSGSGSGLAAPPAAEMTMTLGDEEMRQRFDKQTINKLHVPVLKAWLETKGLGTAGKKNELVDRVEEWFEQKA